jgi:leucyl-tRNA synthetase
MTTEGAGAPALPFRYSAALAASIEERWQGHWEERGTFHTPNPSGALTDAQGRHADPAKRSFIVMDMFPYPSGAGLHVGHPLGYIATDVVGRYRRMCGDNVLHALGYDAFGLPAEQYAVQTGAHPRTTTEANIVTMRRQLGRLGLGHDSRRSFATTDAGYVRWTQWIFLQVFSSWYDVDALRPDGGTGRARPIAELEAPCAAGTRELPADATAHS